MPIQGGVIKTGATGLTVTAGSDVTFTLDSLAIKQGIHVADAAQTDFRIRRGMTFKVQPPVMDKAGIFSKDRKEVSITCPKIGADGVLRFPVIRIVRETYWEQTAAEVLDMNFLAAQVLFDSDYTSYWTSGSLA